MLIGFALSALFLWLALRQVDAPGLVRTFASMTLAPAFLSALALAGGMALRALRWRLVANLPRDRQHVFSRATYLGVLVNLLFPGRVGEVVRVLTLARLSGATLALPLASALIDRLIDVGVLIACASGLSLVLPLDPVLKEWLLYLFVGAAALAAGIVFFLKGAGLWTRGLARLTERWLQRWSLRPDVFLSELRHELHGLLRGALALEVAAVAAGILACDYLAVASLFLAFAIPLSPVAPLLVLVCLAAGSALPSAPGYVGVYQAAAVFALGLFSQPAESAIALATVLQLLALTVALLMNGRGALGLVRQARAAESVAGTAK